MPDAPDTPDTPDMPDTPDAPDTPDTFDQNTWWGTQIHGGEPMHGGEPTYMVAWPALVGGQVGGPGGRAGPAQGARPPGPHPTWPPTKAGLLAGQATMYVGCPPCMASPPCIWLPHHVF